MPERGRPRDHKRETKSGKRGTPQQTSQKSETMEQTSVDPASAFRLAAASDLEAIRPETILALQRTAGNQAVQRLLAAKKDKQPPEQNPVESLTVAPESPATQRQEEERETDSAGQSLESADNAVSSGSVQRGVEEMKKRYEKFGKESKEHAEQWKRPEKAKPPEAKEKPKKKSPVPGKSYPRVKGKKKAEEKEEAPPVPAKTYHMEPIFERTEAARHETESGKKSPDADEKRSIELQIEQEKESVADKLLLGVMGEADLKAGGGNPRGNGKYLDLVLALRKYEKYRGDVPIDDLEGRRTPEVVKKRLTLLEDVEAKAETWWSKFGSWIMSRKSRRQTITALREQVKENIDALTEVKAAIERIDKLNDERAMVSMRAEKPGEVKHLAQEGHYLEAYDPKHRDYDLLHKLYSKWPGADEEEEWQPGLEPPPKEFFDWVDQQEEETIEMKGKALAEYDPLKRDAKLLYKCWKQWDGGEDKHAKAEWRPGKEPPKEFYTYVNQAVEGVAGKEATAYSRIKYYTKDERSRLRLRFESSGKPIHEMSGDEFADGIYVMTPEGEFFAQFEDMKTKGTYHHSSFLAGLPVGAAGKMEYSGGLKVDLESGHYQPRTMHMVNALKGLEKKGVGESADVEVRPFEKNLYTKFRKAKDFLSDLRALKELFQKIGAAGKFGPDWKLLKQGKLKNKNGDPLFLANFFMRRECKEHQDQIIEATKVVD